MQDISAYFYWNLSTVGTSNIVLNTSLFEQGPKSTLNGGLKSTMQKGLDTLFQAFYFFLTQSESVSDMT